MQGRAKEIWKRGISYCLPFIGYKNETNEEKINRWKKYGKNVIPTFSLAFIVIYFTVGLSYKFG